MNARYAAAALPLLLAGCVPTMELRAGPEKEQLVELGRQYCAAERSADPDDTRPLFVASIRSALEEGPAPGAASEPSAECEPGRAWYLGGSRTFIDVRRGQRTERLDFWRGAFPLIHNVIYLPPRRIEGRKVKSLQQALIERPRTVPPVPPLPAPPEPECYPGNYRFAFLQTDTTVYRQGAVVKVTPSIDIAPAGTRAVPVRCTSGWTVTGPATLSADRTTLTIAPDAAPGATVSVTFRYPDKMVRAQFQVIGRDEVVLTGRYSQRGLEGCHVTDPVGELEFSPENRFSVTFNAFETYRDYWGSYSFDPATRRLTLTVERGNFVPGGLDLEGEAEYAGGRLILKNMFLGSRDGSPRSGCTYTF